MVSAAFGTVTTFSRTLQWSHVFSDMVRSLAREAVARYIARLQWSHVFSDMVSYPPGLHEEDPRGASMEPCLFRHGKLDDDIDGHLRPPRFNGAMSFQTW